MDSTAGKLECLADVGEDALVARLTRGFPAGDLVVGPGDDCAVVDAGGDELVLLKTDAVVAGVHFDPGERPQRVGWKAVARVMSDFAAMGGRPEWIMLTLALPTDTPLAWAEGLYDGVRGCLEHGGGVLAGGETTRVPTGSAAVISVAGHGRVTRDGWVPRSGARLGDRIAVTGCLGASLAGHHLDFKPRLREGGWLAAHGATAMMDLSDGLAKDLPRMLQASGCQARIDRDALPCRDGCGIEAAMNDGEDYELLVALDPARFDAAAWPQDFAPLTVIGECVEHGDAWEGGWDSFRS
jgi:thiamine-monophosphate kinase